ncbi:hypothetical protein RND71_028820 [Anisodus tanguticus]|uniref:Uncharacterized protein n=1 Tax=Anisodus tanguticus TaxID=243964 RepID=A0AAE1V2Y7_9SOLA|nr:hypothetical protein RND71_028820 [Anisodus tanguticus]
MAANWAGLPNDLIDLIAKRPQLMIIENGISMICDKSTCGLHHILRGCSMSHLLRGMVTRDGHMDTLEVLVYLADILFVILV